MKRRGAANDRPRWLLACLGIVALQGPAHAQAPSGTGAEKGAGLGAGNRSVLADPTRPPAGLSAGPSAGGAADPVVPVRNPAPPRPQPPVRVKPPMRLQALHLPNAGPPSALVDGRVLREGERLDEWQVERIGPDGLLLRSVVATPAADGVSAGPPGHRKPAGPTVRQLWLPLLPALATANSTLPGDMAGPHLPPPSPPNVPPLASTAARKEP